MKNLKITVNGVAYSVQVEEVSGAAAPAAPAAAPAPAPAPKAAGAGEPVKTQMPGLVKKLCFANGASVKKNDTIVILEAMKMDTPIVATKDGVITYSVTEGSNIDTGTVLCTIA